MILTRGLKFESNAEIGQKGIFFMIPPERLVHEAVIKTPFFERRWGFYFGRERRVGCSETVEQMKRNKLF
jgi:hypothetical protein